MLRSPTWTAGGGSLSEGSCVACISSSCRVRLGPEFLRDIEDMVDILLKSLLVLESFFSFFSSRLSSTLSRLCAEWLRGGAVEVLDSLSLLPNDLQLLSEDERGKAEELWSLECADDGGLGEVGSDLGGTLTGLLDRVGGRFDF